MCGGDVALQGFLVQTLIALLEALKDDSPWTSVTLEPDLESEKVDILWVYQDGTKKAVQVKSSKNPFSPTQVKQWADVLQESKAADRYELCLVGPTTPTVAKLGRVGDVEVPTPKSLDLPAFKSDAAHRLHGLLPKLGLPTRSAGQLDDLVSLLLANLASRSVDRQTLPREALGKLLCRWISHSGTGVRIVRVFVACPKDAPDERAVLDQVVASINRTEGDAHQVRLELLAAEFHPPQPGAAGGFGDAADTPTADDLFLGIVSAAFDDEPRVPRVKRNAYEEVCDLRDQLESLGVVCGYTGVRGGEDSFQNRVSEHLRRTLHLLEPPKPGTEPRSDPTKYLRDLLDKSAWTVFPARKGGRFRCKRRCAAIGWWWSAGGGRPTGVGEDHVPAPHRVRLVPNPVGRRSGRGRPAAGNPRSHLPGVRADQRIGRARQTLGGRSRRAARRGRGGLASSLPGCGQHRRFVGPGRAVLPATACRRRLHRTAGRAGRSARSAGA